MAQSPEGGPFTVVVPEDATPQKIGLLLEQEGVIKSGILFEFAYQQKDQPTILPGEYRFNNGLSPRSAVSLLAKGPPPSIPEVTVILQEGLRLVDFADKLDQAGIVDRNEFLNATRDPEIIKEIVGVKARDLEGYLFPDTYKFRKKTPAKTVIRRLYQNFLDVLPDVTSSGLSRHEFVTLSSIVQREGLLDKERPRIAAVFFNRLKKGMKLETDPTIRFALDRYDTRPILYKDLEVESPYNTYRVYGLPPGPISSVGKASFEAVANPLDSNDIFFVARGDGGHYFARTHREHLYNKAKYKRMIRAQRNR